MKVNVQQFMCVDEKRAFRYMFDQLRRDCENKFERKMGIQSGWLDDSDEELESTLIHGLKKHVQRIEKGEYVIDDVVDAVNFLVMIYNLYEEPDNV